MYCFAIVFSEKKGWEIFWLLILFCKLWFRATFNIPVQYLIQFCVLKGPLSVLDIDVEADEPTEDLQGGAEHKPPVYNRITNYILLYIHLQKLVFSLFIFRPYDRSEIQECILNDRTVFGQHVPPFCGSLKLYYVYQ